MGGAKWVAIAVVLSLLFPVGFYAQDKPLATAKTILDYKDDLKLTQRQVKEIKAYLFDLERRQAELRRELVLVNKEIRELLGQGVKEKGSLDLEKVRERIRRAFGIRAEMVIAEIETAEKINRLLSVEQFERWKEIRSKGK